MDDAMRQLSRRTSPDTSGFSPPKVSPHAFMGAIWVLTALSLVFLPARLYTRWKTSNRFYADDFFVAFAWVLSLAITITVTLLNTVTYDIIYIGAGRKPFPPDVKKISMKFARTFTAVPMIFYSGLWCVKAAFLLFFRRLGTRNIRSLDRWWYIVSGMTSVCYLVCFTTLSYRCTFVSFEVTASPECQTQGLSFVSMRVNCALDVFTDCLIMSIPFLIIRRIRRISTQQKIGLSAVFSLVVITMIFAILRATITTVGVKRQIDPIWMYLWTSIELNIAIVVACVAPYRSLFIRDTNPTLPPHEPRGLSGLKSMKLSASTGARTQHLQQESWTTAELPYLAPWPDQRPSSVVPELRGIGILPNLSDSSVLERCDEPWLTAEMPRLRPWYEFGQFEQCQEQNESSALRPIPEAHVISSRTVIF